MAKTVVDKKVVGSLAKLWPHREHEAPAVAALLSRMGIHNWRRLELADLAHDRDIRFCFWCSKIRIDGDIYTP